MQSMAGLIWLLVPHRTASSSRAVPVSEETRELGDRPPVVWRQGLRASANIVARIDLRQFARKALHGHTPQGFEQLDQRDPGLVREREEIVGGRSSTRWPGRVEQRRDISRIAAHR